jgi:hypothetical protein
LCYNKNSPVALFRDFWQTLYKGALHFVAMLIRSGRYSAGTTLDFFTGENLLKSGRAYPA